MPLTPLTGAHLEALLVVQAIDTDLDRCHHRKVVLPERDELVATEAQLITLDRQLAVAKADRSTVAEREEALADSLASVESRAAELKKRLYGGTVSATRELQAMAAEVDSLTARGSELESRVLEAMEEREPLDDRVDSIAGQKASLLAARSAVEERLVAREAEVDAEIEALTAARHEATAAVPEDLIQTYERLRQRLGGVGAARLVGARCDGCHLTLPATELDQLRHQPPGTLNFCDSCGRILVATQR